MGGKTSSSTSSVQIPPEVLARYNAVNEYAGQVAQTPYQPYGGQFVAPMTSTQNAAITNINQAAGQAQPYFTGASQALLQGQQSATPYYNAAMKAYGGAYDIGANLGQQSYGAITNAQAGAQPYNQLATGLALAGTQAVNPNALDSSSINQYMSPYLGTVLGSAMSAMNQQNALQQSQLAGNAIQQGAFGGDRSGVAAANLAYQQNLANQQTIANLLNTGYGQALSTAQQQQGLGLSAQQANRAALAGGANQLLGVGQQQFGQGAATAQQLAGLGQQQFGQGLTAGQQIAGLGQGVYGMGQQTAQNLAALGTGAQSAALQGAQAQMAAGTQQQQTQQALNTALYNQYLQQQGYPFQVAQFLAGIAEGTGALSGSTTTSEAPSSFFSDRRLKENVKEIGETFDGQPIYRYNYKGHPGTQIGLMAQDVEHHHPEAVGLAGGYKTVDYDRATDDAAHRGHFAYGGSSMGGGVMPEHAYQGFAYGGQPDDVISPYGSGVRGINIPIYSKPTSRGLMIASPPPAQSGGLGSGLREIAGDIKSGQEIYGGGKSILVGSPATDKAAATKGIFGSGGDWDKSKGYFNFFADDVRADGGRIGYATRGAVEPYGVNEIVPDENEDSKSRQLSSSSAPTPKSKNPLGGAMRGASTGAMLGSIIPGIGNVVGAIGGGLLGGLSEMNRGGLVPRDGYARGGEPDDDGYLSSVGNFVNSLFYPAGTRGAIGNKSSQPTRATGLSPSDVSGVSDEPSRPPGLQPMESVTQSPDYVPPEKGPSGSDVVYPVSEARGDYGRSRSPNQGLSPGYSEENPTTYADEIAAARLGRSGLAASPTTTPGAVQVADRRITAGVPAGAGAQQAPAPTTVSGGSAGLSAPPSIAQSGVRPGGEPSSSSASAGEGGVGDWFSRNQSWLVPLLTGIGTMASSPSRYLGAAILQGVGAGAASFGQRGFKEQELGLTGRKLDIEQRTQDQNLLQMLLNRRLMYTQSQQGIPPELEQQIAALTTKVSNQAGTGPVGYTPPAPAGGTQGAPSGRGSYYGQQPAPAGADVSQPLTVRTNNQGAIKNGPWAQSQPGYAGEQNGFAVFKTPEDGRNAHINLLQNYMSQGLNTPQQIITKWASEYKPGHPGYEEDQKKVANYVAVVSKSLGIGPTDAIDPRDPQAISKLAEAMAFVERGGPAPVGRAAVAPNVPTQAQQPSATSIPASSNQNTNAAMINAFAQNGVTQDAINYIQSNPGGFINNLPQVRNPFYLTSEGNRLADAGDVQAAKEKWKQASDIMKDMYESGRYTDANGVTKTVPGFFEHAASSARVAANTPFFTELAKGQFERGQNQGIIDKTANILSQFRTGPDAPARATIDSYLKIAFPKSPFTGASAYYETINKQAQNTISSKMASLNLNAGRTDYQQQAAAGATINSKSDPVTNQRILAQMQAGIEYTNKYTQDAITAARQADSRGTVFNQAEFAAAWERAHPNLFSQLASDAEKRIPVRGAPIPANPTNGSKAVVEPGQWADANGVKNTSPGIIEFKNGEWVYVKNAGE